MSFGSTKIGGAKYGNTLVFSPGGGTPPTPDPGDISNYVQDGLVAHFDGIDTGTTSGRWASLVGSSYVTLNSHAVAGDNNVSFDGAAGLAVTNPVSINYSAGTIEMVAENSTSGNAAIYYGRTNKLSFIVAGSGYSFGVGSSNNQWNIDKVAKFVASANAARFMLNGEIGGTLASNSWSDKSSTMMGATPSGTRYWFTGKIYAIRIYNRQLTEAEMLTNQIVDNTRFNLGLNIL